MSENPEIRSSVLLFEEGKVLLALHRKKGWEYWVLPGGHVEDGESPEAAAVREIKEETGLEVRVDRLAFVCDSILQEGGKVVRHVVNLVYLASRTGGHLARGEDFGVLVGLEFIPVGDLEKLPFYPRLGPEILRASEGRLAACPEYLGIR